MHIRKGQPLQRPPARISLSAIFSTQGNYTMKNEPRLYVERLKDGRFQFRLRFSDPVTGKARRVSTIKASNSKQAYNQALRELQARVDISETDLSLDDARKLYLEAKGRSLKPQTIIRNDTEITAVNRVLGSMQLSALNTLRLQKAILRISPENHTYNERLSRYKAFLNWCYESDLIEVDWWRKMKPLPDNYRQRIENKYLEPDELSRLLEAMSQPMWYYLTLFLVLSGLRVGEAIALELADIGEYISVDKTFSLVTGAVGTTKTGTSRRDVFIQPELKEVLDRYFIFRASLRTDSPLLFPGKEGALSYAAYNKYLKEKSEAVLGRRITAHALRHTSTSLYAASGVNIETLSRRLGHSSSQITKEIYLHITEKQKQKDNAAFVNARILP